jgi:predicted nucleic acid-binding protein
MNGVLIDTSFWFALAVASDAKHQQASQTARAMQKRGDLWLTTTMILAEMHRLVLYKVGTWAGNRFLTQINKQNETGFLEVAAVGWEHISIARTLLDKYSDQALSLTDACSAAIMRELNLEKYAGYDEHFQLLGFARVGE